MLVGIDSHSRADILTFNDGFPASEKGREPQGIWCLVSVTLAGTRTVALDR